MTAPGPTRSDRPNRALVLLAVVFVLLAVVPGAVSLIAQGYESRTQRSTTLTSDVAALTVRNGVGDVEVVPSLDDRVHVRTNAVHGLEPPVLTEESTAAGVLLAARCEDALAVECAVDYTIEVPRDFAVRLELGVGDAVVHGLTGGVTLDAVSGNVLLSAVSGPLSVRGEGGDVEAVGIASDDVLVQRTSGDIAMDLVSAPSAVQVRAEHGDVLIGVPGGERYRVDSWSQDGETMVGVRTDASAEHAISATSGSGNVLIRTSQPGPRLVGPDGLLDGDGPAPVPPLPPRPPKVPAAPDLTGG